MFDRDTLIAACTAHGRVVRVVIAAVHGSAPREVGAAMCVWESGQSGTIGGGALEYELAIAARALTQDTTSRHALGPDLGQCCGGAVEVLSEVFDLPRALALPTDVIARGPDPMPLSIKRMLSAARNQGQIPDAQRIDGWMIEGVRPPDHALWIWGAGHVGRALVDVLHPIPGIAITWVDTAADRFPDDVPNCVTVVPAGDPSRLVPHAPVDADHLILTYSHDLDLSLCHAVLQHGFGSAGLIGSATKWARFRKRLSMLGHGSDQIARITCPIGDPALGKQPHMIAIGVAHRLLMERRRAHVRAEVRA
ncbi:xanthine dehydrogenase accessory protein XdhC [Tateyamaria armeniaca]|uniref:Xanthine dehydrogenase accessory protein XdhC n=1 Tax=Tateyamaria armeniaca TaxID=2518930 RepID=A0ABW8USN6_9RHOB